MTKRSYWVSFLTLSIAASMWSGKLVYDARQRAESAKRESEFVKSLPKTLPDADMLYEKLKAELAEPGPRECPDYMICI